MQALKFTGGGRAEVLEVPVPDLKPGWVRLRVMASCLCGSDLLGYRSPAGHRVTPGHEVAGEVEAVGAGVTTVRPGDRVSVYAIHGCGRCPACVAGRIIFCRGVQGVIGFSFDGGDADMALVPAAVLYPVPEDVTWEQAALMGDGVGTPFHALKRVGARIGETLGVFGLGPVGLGAVNVAKFMGIKVVAADVNAYRLDLALRLGADISLNPQDPGFQKDLEASTNGEGLDRALDTSGSEATTNLALDSVKRGGWVAFVGEKNSATIRPSAQFIRKEITVVGNWYHEWSEYDEVVAMIRRGFVPERTVTHRFPIAQGPEAFRLFAEGRTGKVVLVAE